MASNNNETNVVATKVVGTQECIMLKDLTRGNLKRYDKEKEQASVARTPSPRLSIRYDCSCFQRTTFEMLEGMRA
ncbi:unnamed protein product [Dovyalis caffra]|uniref:Uncharacterized protein n=1 Tax=Dovyalis caffra TaxID=77055 RepID=A0AAV1RKW5_9ROSI|nr:unnamed protein product [Dovyalis caffra]